MKTLRPQLSRFQNRVACLAISLALYLAPFPAGAVPPVECDMACCKHGVKHHSDHKSGRSIHTMATDCCSNSPCALQTPAAFGHVECLVTQTRFDLPRDAAGLIISAVSTFFYSANRQPGTLAGRSTHRKLPPLYLQHRTFLI
jgi:hypothetical protein